MRTNLTAKEKQLLLEVLQKDGRHVGLPRKLRLKLGDETCPPMPVKVDGRYPDPLEAMRAGVLPSGTKLMHKIGKGDWELVVFRRMESHDWAVFYSPTERQTFTSNSVQFKWPDQPSPTTSPAAA